MVHLPDKLFASRLHLPSYSLDYKLHIPRLEPKSCI
jgi:hypothetical protein